MSKQSQRLLKLLPEIRKAAGVESLDDVPAKIRELVALAVVPPESAPGSRMGTLKIVELLNQVADQIDKATDVLADTLGEDGREAIEAQRALATVMRTSAKALMAPEQMEENLEHVRASLMARGYVSCPNCKELNKPGTKYCVKCGAQMRPDEFDIPPFMKRWKCLVCPSGTMNAASAEVCEVCGKPRGTPAPEKIVVEPLAPPPFTAPRAPSAFTPPKPIAPFQTSPVVGGWKCDTCQAEGNTGKFCKKCGASKPGDTLLSRISFAEVSVTGVTLTLTPDSIRLHGGRGQASAVVHLSNGQDGLPEGHEIFWRPSANLHVNEMSDTSQAVFAAEQGAKPGRGEILVQVVLGTGESAQVVAEDTQTVELTNGAPALNLQVSNANVAGVTMHTLQPSSAPAQTRARARVVEKRDRRLA